MESVPRRMVKIALLSNPLSHTNGQALPEVRAIAASCPDVLHEEIAAIEDIPALLAGCAAREPDILAVNGGDGTVQAVMSALINDPPFARPIALAVLPGGKTNMLAADLGVKSDPARGLRRLIGLAGQGVGGRIEERPVLGLRRTPGAPIVYGTFFGAGSVVRAIEHCRAHIFPLGLPNALSHAASLILLIGGALRANPGPGSPFRPDTITIQLGDEAAFSGHFFAVFATTLDNLVLNMRPFEAEGGGSVHLTAIRHKRATILKTAAAALTRRPRHRIEGTVSRNVDRAVLRLDCPVTLDGEMFYPTLGQPVELLGDKTLAMVNLAP